MFYWDRIKNISELEGKTLTEVTGLVGGIVVYFTTDTGEKYSLEHSQDCCESVYIEDICGDLDDLVGSPIVSAYVETSDVNPEDAKIEYQDVFQWTFYRISTVKGTVVFRWYGDSNGYYSVDVDFTKVR